MRRDDSQGTKNVTKKRPIAMPKKLAITNKQDYPRRRIVLKHPSLFENLSYRRATNRSYLENEFSLEYFG